MLEPAPEPMPSSKTSSNACVMDSYFREHMAERDLLFHDTVASHLAAYAPEASAAQQCDYLTHLHQTLNAPSHPIRNRLGRITTDSPDLLAIIKMDGNVEKKTSTEAEPIQEDEPPPIQHSFL